jgi:hypothetical protein
MEKLSLIKGFVEDHVSIAQFCEALHNDPSFEVFFENSTPIPPYTSAGYGIYLYLLERNFKSINEIIDMKDLLSKFLNYKGIEHNPDTSILNKYGSILKAQPKWLDLPPDYIGFLLKEAGNIDGKELVNWLKNIITERFIYISGPPRWLQSPNWPIENNTPLIYIGQLDISKVSHDTCNLYMFYNSAKKEFKQVIQSV